MSTVSYLIRETPRLVHQKKPVGGLKELKERSFVLVTYHFHPSATELPVPLVLGFCAVSLLKS